jgi:oligopeptide/dipeptide ABC transporter ATP-binding protein
VNTNPYPVLRVRALRKHFDVGHPRKKLNAVDDVAFDLFPGETLAVVGESGSGKSTLARCIVRLIEPSAGEIELDGRSITELGPPGLARAYRQIQMVFQDPNSSLNPRMTVRQAIEEPLRLQLKMGRGHRGRRSRDLAAMVELADEHLDRYPHQLSGGQRQRVGIARALAAEPEVVILDEPTSSLDVSVRGQILELLQQLQESLNLAYLFITHDLQVVRRVSHRVAVMYLGGIVEQGRTEDVFTDPFHPYTRALTSAAPTAQWGVTRQRFRLTGEIPSPVDLPDSCRLVGRCPLAEKSCHQGKPALIPLSSHRSVACPPALSQRQSLVR